ncbi:hypothetical protein SO802_007367 [Lithocarpus litseifolius]|uniref:Retropepsins domain-containing protein n=1 Tax=Lithocarpus litseifolius TaxID=425828 RepID=A0AAW2DQ47_9ROSI
MIDSGADMNCIQEGLIPSKYFEKSTERLVSANGSQMRIKYELNNTHVCHDNVCFKIPSVLVKNMHDKVILGLPFINALYPFLVEHDSITADPFGQKVKFKFASKLEIDIDYAINLSHNANSSFQLRNLVNPSTSNFDVTNILDPSWQEYNLVAEKHTTDINTTNKWIKDICTTSKWNIMSSSAARKIKGKAPAQGYPQDKRIPAGQSFVMHEGVSSGMKSRGSTSLQEFAPAKVAYSSGDMFHNGAFSELPNPVKVLLDNLQAAFTINHRKLFKKTFQALEIHLVNLTAQNEVYEGLLVDLTSDDHKTYASHPVNQPFSDNEAFASHSTNEAFASHPINHDLYTSQLFGREEIHSMDKMTIMGTDYARFSLKTQSDLKSTVANLPTDIQVSILEIKAMFRSFDQWYKYFKKLVTATIPDPDDLDVDDNFFFQLSWEEHFGSSSKVYERKHPFPGLLINYEDNELDKEEMDPDWLSQMFEFGFIRLIRLSN